MLLSCIAERGIASTTPFISKACKMINYFYTGRSLNRKFRVQKSGEIQKRSFSNRSSAGSDSDSNFNEKTNGVSSSEDLTIPDWNSVTLKPFKKDFYVPHETVERRSDEEVNEYRRIHNITVSSQAGLEIPKPIQHINEANFPDYINDILKREGFETPTATQAQGWPIVMSGHNMVGIAQTGSGKTLTYMLPAIVHIKDQPPVKPGEGPIVVVLAPTTELAQRIEVVASLFGTCNHVRSTCLFSGARRRLVINDLVTGREIVIATPKRLLRLLRQGTTNMRRTTFLVLDETDRMLDLGLEPQIRKIIEQIRPDRQVLIWSDTWPESVRTLAEDFLHKKYIQLNVGSLTSDTNRNIKQNAEIGAEDEKDNRNILNLQNRGMIKAIHPENCSADEIVKVLKKKPQHVYAGFDPTASSLHVGNLLILVNLLHWQRSGHHVIALLGCATARIGDPCGHTKDREEQNQILVRERALSIRKDIENIFSNHEKYFWSRNKNPTPLPPIKIVDNEEWYKGFEAIDFFKRVCRKFRMDSMLSKTSVNKRLESEGGMNYVEFCYQVFQGYDWLHLLKTYGCRFQIGGSDQLGNIIAGHGLIDLVMGQSVYGLTLPLITNEAGEKFGKSSGNAVWLNRDLTSPSDFYNFFFETEHSKVEELLKLFTFLSLEEIAQIMEKHSKAPEKRIAQTKLAEEVTLLVHGSLDKF